MRVYQITTRITVHCTGIALEFTDPGHSGLKDCPSVEVVGVL